MNRRRPGQRSEYHHFEPLQMRWADTDIYGHMNNAVHYLLFDTAVQSFLIANGLLDIGRSKTVFFVAASECRYFEEIAFGDGIEAGMRITRLGTTSVTYEISIFRRVGEVASATGSFTHVNVSRDARIPEPLNDAARKVFVRLQTM